MTHHTVLDETATYSTLRDINSTEMEKSDDYRTIIDVQTCDVQAKAVALIKSSASLSRGVIEHSNFGGLLLGGEISNGGTKLCG